MSKLKTLGTADLVNCQYEPIQILPNFDPAHILPTMIVDSLSCQNLNFVAGIFPYIPSQDMAWRFLGVSPIGFLYRLGDGGTAVGLLGVTRIKRSP